MFRFHSFDYEPFDYMSGTLPDVFKPYIGDQLRRAREILGHRTNAQIAYGLTYLDWMFRSEKEFLSLSFLEDIKGDSQHICRNIALCSLISKKDISEIPIFSDAKWEEFFALLVIVYTAEALYLHNYPNVDALPIGDDPPKPISDSPILMNTLMIESLEAISFAEGLKIGAEQNNNRNEMAKRGKKGGDARREKFALIRGKCIELYNAKYPHIDKYLEAARLIVKELTNDDLKVLFTDKPENTIARWISDFKRYDE